MCEPCVDGLDLETEWNSLDGLVCVNTLRTDTIAEKLHGKSERLTEHHVDRPASSTTVRVRRRLAKRSSRT